MKNNLNANDTFKLALENHKNNNIQIALDLYKQVLKIDPDSIDALNNLGIIFNQLGKYQKAISFYQKAIKINPNFTQAHRNLTVIFFKLGEFENSYNHHVKFLQLKSKGIVSNAELKNVIPMLVNKLQKQNQVPTFFDNAALSQLTEKSNSNVDYCDIFEKGQLSKKNRFISYSERTKKYSESIPTNQLFSGLPFLVSQGVHSVISWKGIPLFKTTFDLSIYSMILQEVKPEVIVELGSGLGSSAIWLADTAAALGLDTHVYSFDLKKPLLNHKRVTFVEYDLNETDKLSKLPCWKNFTGKKIIIEDAHVNLKNILNLFDTILKKDDYLIIEDSVLKQDIISDFSIEKESKYKLDQFFLDFFGVNITCCINSIFKCY